MPSPPLPRFDIPVMQGLMGLAYRARWALAGTEKRNRQLLRILWNAESWRDEDHTAWSLIHMRMLVDLGVALDKPSGTDLTDRLAAKVHDGQRSLLGWEALRAIKEGLPSGAIHLLIEAGAPVDFRESNHYNDSLLTCAIRHRHMPALRLLLKAGADLEMVDTCDTSPLRLAVQLYGASNHPGDRHEKMSMETVEALLSAGAKPDYAALYFTQGSAQKDLPYTPLLEAACRGWLAGVERLLGAGARLEGVGEISGTGFAQAFAAEAAQWSDHQHAGRAFSAMLDLLLGAGMDLSHANHAGENAVFAAVEGGNLGLAMALLDRGAQLPNAATPLSHLLIRRGGVDEDEVQAFLGRVPAGFWSERDPEGFTALDRLQQRQAKGQLRPFEDRWLAFLEAGQLSNDTLRPSTAPRARPRL